MDDEDFLIGTADPKPEPTPRGTDIVEHLKTFPYWGYKDLELHRDAAAEIERLRAELEKQRTAHNMWFNRAFDLEQQLEEARRG